jgi:hypothetical protein
MPAKMSIGATVIVAKGDGVAYDYHSVQANLDDCAHEKDSGFWRTRNLIPHDAVYRELPQVMSRNHYGILQDDPNEEYGLEKIAHVTLLYGLVNENDFFPVRRNFAAMEAPTFKIGKISSFRNPDKPYDVILLEIDSPAFHVINKQLRTYKNENTYPEYKPHMTLGYVKKGALADLDGKDVDWTGTEYRVGRAEWSHKDKFKLPLPFKGG